MTEDRLPLAELLAKSGDGDFLRTIAESVLQIIMEADVEGLVGAARRACAGGRARISNWRTLVMTAGSAGGRSTVRRCCR